MYLPLEVLERRLTWLVWYLPPRKFQRKTSNQRRDYPAGTDRIRPVQSVIDALLRIHSQAMVQRRVQVHWIDRVRRPVTANPVGSAVNPTAADAATGQ